jgi:hypothetical protein
MKEYDLYVPSTSVNGSPGSSWSWLEKMLDAEFGNCRSTTAVHEGEWRDARVRLQGKLRAFTVQGNRTSSRAFFRKLKKHFKEIGLDDFVIVEKEASHREGELTGERI